MTISLSRKTQKPKATTIRFGAGPASLAGTNVLLHIMDGDSDAHGATSAG